jgi:aspartate aminotransferase/aminotransferase
MNAKTFIADRMVSISSSGIRRIFDLAATMTDPIDFSIGQPDFHVPDNVKQAAAAAITNDFNGYTVTHGIAPLRDGIKSELIREFEWDPEVFVTSGVSGGLALALLTCLNPGDEVIFADPYFVSYPYLVNLVGGRPVPVGTYPAFDLPADRLEAAVTERTKLMVMNSPGNPTGVVYAASQVAAVCEVARRHDLLIVSDEIYNKLSFDGPVASPVTYAPERTILLRGFGKTYGMTGWRMGYAAGPAEIVTEMAKLQQYTFVCAPNPFQHACLEALKTDMSATVKAYGQKRDLVADILARKFEFPKPAGGFYFFPRAPKKFSNSTDFVEAAIKRNVLTVPGNVFSQHDTHFRISYAVDDEKLIKGCETLCALAD